MTTTTKPITPRIGLQLETTILRQDDWRVAGDRPGWTITLRPVLLGRIDSYDPEDTPADRVRNPSDSCDYHGLFLHGLEIVAWAREERDGTRGVWHWEYRFDVHKVDSRNVRRLARTIATIDRRLLQLTARDGNATTFADYVRRLAAVLKVQAMLQARSTRGWSHDETDYALLGVGEGLNTITHAITRWQAEGAAQRASA